MRFDQEICRAAGVDWKDAEATNRAMDELAASRLVTVELDDVLIRSKVAWKFAILRQALTYRLVDLGESAICSWNDENLLPSIVLARAFLETSALLHSIGKRMRNALDKRVIGDLDDIAMKESFGGKKKEWIDETSYQSTNVLTALDHMSKDIEFVREFYESLSEIAHPNSFGTGQFYATIDKQNIVTHFSRTKRSSAEVFLQINLALLGVEWSNFKLREFDRMIVEIAELQHELDPVGLNNTSH